MTEINGIGIPNAEFFEKFKHDLETVFSNYVTETTEDGTLNIYLNEKRDFYLSCYFNTNNATTLKIHYGADAQKDLISFGTYISPYYGTYKMCKLDNGVICISKIRSGNNSTTIPPSYQYLQLYVDNCTDVLNGDVRKAVYFSGGTSDTAGYYTVYAETASNEMEVSYGNSASELGYPSITQITPAFTRHQPWYANNLQLKLQSQRIYGKIKLNGKWYLSGAVFCVPIEEE